jgi:hypothetical protein
VFFIPSMGCHTRFAGTEIGMQDYAELKETRYSYADVSRMVVVGGHFDDHGKYEADPQLLLDFKNGRKWSTRDGFRNPSPLENGLVPFLSLHTGLQPVAVKTESELK